MKLYKKYHTSIMNHTNFSYNKDRFGWFFVVDYINNSHIKTYLDIEFHRGIWSHLEKLKLYELYDRYDILPKDFYETI